MRKPLIGSFIKYTWKGDLNGTYGIVFRLNPTGKPSDGQVIWFNKKPTKHFSIDHTWYHISGFLYNRKRKDCKMVFKPPKNILKRVEKALIYAREQNLDYMDNLTMIEILGKVVNL